MRLAFAAAITAAAFSAAAPALAAPPTYRLTHLGSFGGNLVPQGLNNSGNVVGYAYPPGVSSYAFFSDGSTSTRFLGGLAGSIAFAINNKGLVVGISPSDGVIFDVNTNTVVGDFGQSVYPRDINDLGQVTGKQFVSNSPTQRHAIFYDGTTVHDLGTLPGWPNSEGLAINNIGHVVGFSYVVGGANLGFFWDGVTMRALAPLTPQGSSSARDINDNDQVVGLISSPVNSESAHAAMWDSTGLHDLGTLHAGWSSIAYGVNNRGEIVGTAIQDPGPNPTRAFYYDGSAMYDLNDLIDSSDPLKPSFTMTASQGINDNGQIVASGCFVFDTSLCYGFLLTPVPTP